MQSIKNIAFIQRSHLKVCMNIANLSKYAIDKTCVINDPLGQTHSPTSSDHYFHATFILFCDILKTDVRTEI